MLKGQKQEILRLRRELKHRKPRPVPRNLLWALDLTFLPGPRGPRAVLGLLDHGTRTCLALHEIRTRSTINLLRALLDAVEGFGRPRILRTDNEPVFTSRLFRLGLFCLGIRHRRTAPFAPWQNGRIERFFATFKDRILPWLAENGIPDDLDPELALFRALVQPRATAPAPRRTHPGSGLGRQGARWTTALRLGVEWTAHRLPLAFLATAATDRHSGRPRTVRGEVRSLDGSHTQST